MTHPNALRVRGAIAAMITPFRKGAVDQERLRALVEWQIANGIAGIAVCTVTGEGPVLASDERSVVVSTAVQAAAGRIPVIAATGTNCTATTIELTQRAADLGASAALVTVPYYSKPGPKGIVHHFEQLGRASPLPLIVETDPARTASDLSEVVLEKLADISPIHGICDAVGDVRRLAAIPIAHLARFRWFTGNDLTASAFAAQGGDGLISPGANILPRLFSSMQQSAQGGNLAGALAILDRLMPLLKVVGTDRDPVCIKLALRLLRGVDDEVRLPLVRADRETEAAITAALEPFLGRQAAAIPMRF
ncbi:4-hydroxy-tetrahydrodipicolinate synthase [Rhizobium sp. P32RR-XVIII]|uniref:4-hydroxy-tetrahydrodipicolinate synthase n=1 Tax=Rhizobium sp. P32RR-XVIII TaxID=2726738 RepID=UPI0028A64083|nr:4-hydroxy-tetrahydrodipicolinate synthase [Rhizobium sp. P32RR-XVIII]